MRFFFLIIMLKTPFMSVDFGLGLNTGSSSCPHFNFATELFTK